MAYKEISPKEIESNVFSDIGDKWMLVTAGDETGYNTMTASWGGMGIMWNKCVVTIGIRPQRYTLGFVEKNDRFTLSFFSEKWRDALKFCGSKSGRDYDKAKETGLTPLFLDGTTAFSQAERILVCKKLYVGDLDPAGFLDKALDETYYPNKDYHKLFVAEIVKVLEKE